MKNLLLILPEFYPHPGGGLATFYLQLLPALKPFFNKIKVIVGSGYTNGEEKFLYKEIEVEYLSPKIFQKYLTKFEKFNPFPELKKNVASAWAMYEQADYGRGFDLVECTDFGLGFIPWLVQRTIPLCIRLHGSSGQINYYDPSKYNNLEGDFNKLLEKTLLEKAFLSTYSQSNYAFWKSINSNLYIHKVLPVFTELSENPVPYKNRSQKGVVTGRLQFWKGPVTTCEALQKTNSHIKVDWYGRDMPYFSSNETMGQFLSKKYPGIWQNTLLYKGSLPKSEVQKIQETALFGLVPSYWDMFNFTGVELMAHYTPVICSDKAGVSELFEDGVNGFIFQSTNEDDLSDKLEKAFTMSEIQFGELTKQAYLTIKSKLSSEKLIPEYLNLYESCHQFDQPEMDQYFSKMLLPETDTYSHDITLNKIPLKEMWDHTLKRTLQKIIHW